MACAREWLAPILSSETTAEIEHQIGEKGAAACYRTLFGMKYPDRVRGWTFDPDEDYPFKVDRDPVAAHPERHQSQSHPDCRTRRRRVFLLHEKHPQAKRWMDMAVQSAHAFSMMFGADGSYDEGVAYWGYTALHLTSAGEACGGQSAPTCMRS